MKPSTQPKSAVGNFKKAPHPPRSTILASCVGAAACLLFAANAHAGLIFQDTFDSDPTGATRVISSFGNQVDSISSTSSLGGGSSLNSTVAVGKLSSGYTVATYTPTSAASSWAAMASTVTVNGNNFLALNGGFDLFVKQNGTATNDSWYRPIVFWTDQFALILGSNGSTGLKNEVFTNAGNYLQNAGTAPGDYNTPWGFTGFDRKNYQIDTACSLLTVSQPLHIAYTFSTSETTGAITIKTYVVEGTGAIDTATTTAINTMNLYINAAGVGSTPLTSGAWEFQAGQVSWDTGSNVDYDAIRLYDSAPATFTSLATVPEPTTVGLVTGGVLLLALSRKKLGLSK